MEKQYFIYILSNRHNTTLYTGVTNDLMRRVYEHKNKQADGFTKRYNLDKLVYFETAASADTAIAREKQIKKRTRNYKQGLINGANPEWKDLYADLV